MSELCEVIDKLSKHQRDVLIQIALNNDAFHHPRTVKSLEERGLIIGEDERLGGRFPVRVRRYHTPLPVHMAVCEWCSLFAAVVP